MELRRGIGLLLAVGILSLLLGWTTGTAVSARPGSSAESAPATSTPPRTGVTDQAPSVRRVLLAGDSVMAGLAPAVQAALGGDGTEVEFLLTPSILRDATVRFAWEQELVDFDPQVVVLLVGTWELGEVQNGRGAATTGEDWQSVYGQQILDPWVELVTSRGAEVVWLGTPVVPSDDTNRLFEELNESYRSLEARWPAVRYLDSTAVLTAGSRRFTDSLVTEDGTRMRVRQVDGLHLCPEGAALMAEELVTAIAETWTVTENEGWWDGTWRGSEEYPPEDCPPIS